MIDENVTSEGVKSTNKDLLAMKTKNYGHLGNSAGQDNIGQIISAMLSFRRLKKQMGNDYTGGLLLIDEIDATLYAGSQIHLIKELYSFARIYDVQVVFTTHSLEILDYLSEYIGESTKINFLELKNQKILNKLNPSLQFLSNKIKVQTGEEEDISKLQVVCEDKEAEFWCKNLLNGTDLRKYVHVEQGPFGEGFLSRMEESKHPIFKTVFFVFDGDCRADKSKKLRKAVFLPEDRPPEIVFYNYLKNLDDQDSFWLEDDKFNYSKQTVFQNYSTGDLNTAKKWFKDSCFRPLFGRSYSRLFNRWKRDNEELVTKFQDDFSHMIEGSYTTKVDKQN